MKFEEWLSQQDGVIEVDCGCVTTEAFYHWMRVAYDGGAAASFWGGLFEEIKGRSSPHPGDFTPPTDMSVEDIIDALNNMQQEKRIADAVELLKKAAPAMLADNGGPDGPLAGRLKSPVIPDGYVMVPKEPTDEMIAAAMNCDDVLFNSDESFCVQFGNIYEAMLAASQHDTPALNSLQSVDSVAGKWIPVSEQMPEREYVLAADFSGKHYSPCQPNTQVGIYADWFDDGNPTWDDGDGEDLHLKEVTHWMPLPAGPKEVK